MQPTAMLTKNADFWSPPGRLDALTIDRFLPLSRMKQLAASAHSTYLKAVPYPPIVLDDFSTIFRARHEGEFKLTRTQRLRSTARDLATPDHRAAAAEAFTSVQRVGLIKNADLLS
jgi:hypothetical protein